MQDIFNILTEEELEEYVLRLKFFTTDDKVFAKRVIQLILFPYKDIAEMLYEKSYKEFGESERHFQLEIKEK